MFAVFQTGGHQYRVSQGDQITVDFLDGKNEGDKVSFTNVLALGGDQPSFGALQGITVEAVVKKQTYNEKILIGKFKRRKDYKRTKGHRQPVTVLEISGITK